MITDKDEIYDEARKVLNETDVRLAISKKFSQKKGIHQGGTFFGLRTLKGYTETTGPRTKLLKWMSKQMSDAPKGTKKVFMDVASHPKTCSHYSTLMIDLIEEYALVFDSGLSMDKRRMTYVDNKRRIYPIYKAWLKKNAKEFFPNTKDSALYEALPNVPLQLPGNVMCQTYTLMFRAQIKASWDFDEIIDWMDDLATNKKSDKEVTKHFRKIFSDVKIAKDRLINATGNKNAPKTMSKLTTKWMI
jgi:hypothetical protein